jgi:hypothetical protein
MRRVFRSPAVNLLRGCVALALGAAIVLSLSMTLHSVKALSSQLLSHFAFGVSARQGDTWMPQTGHFVGLPDAVSGRWRQHGIRLGDME